MNAGKPRNRDGYTPEDLLQVRSTCLTVAATLGAQLDRLCIVGGLVPNLLIDERCGPDPQTGDVHPGTSDLDVAMQIALLDNKAYAEITTRLRQEGFGPDTNERGNPTPQRWKLAGHKVTIDFLLPPIDHGPAAARVQSLEPDFGALIIPGVELAADEREWVELDGHTESGSRARCPSAARVHSWCSRRLRSPTASSRRTPTTSCTSCGAGPAERPTSRIA